MDVASRLNNERRIAAIVERSGRFLSLFAALLFVVLFTVRETGLAQIVYYLPEMDKFRHIAYMLSSAKWLAIVCAGLMSSCICVARKRVRSSSSA